MQNVQVSKGGGGFVLNIQGNVFNAQCAQITLLKVADLVDRINCRNFHHHQHIYDFESYARGRTYKWHCYCLWTELERGCKLTFFLTRGQTTSQSHRTLLSVLGLFFAKCFIFAFFSFDVSSHFLDVSAFLLNPVFSRCYNGYFKRLPYHWSKAGLH